jgi:RNA polymerase sigma-70 factor (ECF subfamily)
MGGAQMMSIDVLAGPGAPSEGKAEVLTLFEEHGTALYRFSHSMLGSRADAQDVVQEAFLKLLEHLRAGGDRANLRAWLFTVAANACRDRARRRLRWLPWSAELDARTTERAGEPRDLARARAAFRGLPPRDRLLLSLRAQGLSYRDIGAAAGIRESSVGKLLARAIDRVKRGLE